MHSGQIVEITFYFFVLSSDFLVYLFAVNITDKWVLSLLLIRLWECFFTDSFTQRNLFKNPSPIYFLRELYFRSVCRHSRLFEYLSALFYLYVSLSAICLNSQATWTIGSRYHVWSLWSVHHRKWFSHDNALSPCGGHQYNYCKHTESPVAKHLFVIDPF